MRVASFRRRAGAFRLFARAPASRFAGLPGADLPAVRVIEDGPVQSVIEGLFGWGGSLICQH